MKRCRYCNAEMDVSDASYAENPFCAKCLPERMALTAAGRGPGTWVLAGEYVVWRPETEIEAGGEPKMLNTIGRIAVAKYDAELAVAELGDAMRDLMDPHRRERAAQVGLGRAKERLEESLKYVIEAQENWPPD